MNSRERATRANGVTQIPEAAAAIVALINTRPHGPHPDALDDPATVMDIARIFAPEAHEASDDAIEAIRAARTSLVEAISDPTTWPAFSELTSGALFRQSITPNGVPEFTQVEGNRVIGGIALAAASLLADGRWDRVRLCANTYCTHAFYDTTRNRSQRWDSYESCGNRMNVAAYRTRKNASDTAPPV